MTSEIVKTRQLQQSKIANCPVFIPNKLTSLSHKLKLTESEVQFVGFDYPQFEDCLEPYFYKFFAGDKSLVRGFADVLPQDLYLWHDVRIGSNRFVKEVVNTSNRFAKVVVALSQSKSISKQFLVQQNKFLRPKDKVLGLRTSKIRAGDPRSNPYAFYCAPVDTIDELMLDLVNFINTDNETALNHALITMLQLIFIHPFKDGNGRTSRALFLAMMKKKYGLSFSCLFMLYLKNINRMGYYAAIADYRQGKINSLHDFYLHSLVWVNQSMLVLNELFSQYTNKINQESSDRSFAFSHVILKNKPQSSHAFFIPYENKANKDIYINSALLSCINQFDYYLRNELRIHLQSRNL